jgi:hypothetical protein
MDSYMNQEKQGKRDKVDDALASTTGCRVTSAGSPIMCPAVSLPRGQEGLLEVGQGAERQHVHRSLASQGPAGVCWGRDVVSSGRLCVAGRGEWAGSREGVQVRGLVGTRAGRCTMLAPGFAQE